MIPVDGARRNHQLVTERSAPVDLQVVGGPTISMSMCSHTFSRVERYCAPCARWVTCDGILGALLRPCCQRTW